MSFNLNKLVQPECGGPNPLVATAQQIAMKPSTSASSLQYRIRNNQRHQIQANFTKEFMEQTQQQQQHSNAILAGPQIGAGRTSFIPASQQLNNFAIPTSSIGAQTGSLSNNSSGGKLATDFLTEQELMRTGLEKLNLTSGQQNIPFCLPSARMQGLAYPANMTQGHQIKGHQLSDSLAGDQLETKYRNDLISQTNTTDLGAVATSDEGKLDDIQFWQSLSQQYMGPPTFNNIARMKAGTSKQSASPKDSSSDRLATDELTEQQQQDEASASEAAVNEDFLFGEDMASEMKVPSDMDYVFDERNPLKDRFEDPFAEGLKKLKQGDIPSAALLFEAAVQREPDNSAAWRYLGTTQAQNEKDLSAIRALKNCLRIDSNDQEARLAIAVSLANETYQNEACKYLLEWLINHDRYKSINASFEEFKQLDSELAGDPFFVNAIDKKHYNYVRDKFVEAARMSPNNPDHEVQSSLGVLFNMRGEYEKAVDCFKAALSVRSDDSLLWNRLGATLANGNKSDEAVIAYRKALEISPGFLRSRYNLAISLIHLNTYEEAAKQLVQILNMQAAGKGSKNTQIRTRSITSTAIWNTLRTVATLLNKPELYPIIDGRDLARCNEEMLLKNRLSSTSNLSPETADTTTSSN